MLRRHRTLLLVLLLLFSLAAACGDDNSGAATTPAPTTAAPATTAPSGSATTAAPATTTAPTMAPTTTAAPMNDVAQLVVATGDSFACFDPATCSSSLPNTVVNYHIFSTLVGHIGNPMELVPNLATEWSYSDPETVTFKLNPDAMFQDGTPVTADDVVYSFAQYALPESPRARYVAAIVSVVADDAHTVTFKTDGPRTDLMGNLARLLILPQAAREAAGAEAFGLNPVGSGPYEFVSFENDRIVLTRNENWFGPHVQPARIELATTKDPATRAALLQSGEADVIDGVSLEAVSTLDGGDTEVISLKGARTIMYVFKTNEPPFDNLMVRQAANYAIDRQALLDSVLQGRGELLHGPWASGWIGYDPNLDPYPYNPQMARDLLTQAGYPNGVDTTFYITDGNRMKDGELGQAIQAMLADVGIRVQLIPTPSSTTNDNWKSGEYTGLTSVTWAVPGDPGGMVIYSFGNANSLAPDATLADLVSKTQTLVDPDERATALFDLGHYVNDQALWLFVHAQDQLYAKRADVAWEPVPITSGGATVWYWEG